MSQINVFGSQRNADGITGRELIAAQDPVADGGASLTARLVELRKYIEGGRICRLDDWAVDKTGATDNATQIQAWQDQAESAGYIAVAPAGIYGLASKVTFKAPTVGAGANLYGAKSGATLGNYTMFRNTAINDGSWMIDVKTALTTHEFGGTLKGFRLHAGGRNVSLLRVLGRETAPTGYAWEQFLWDDIAAYGGRVNLMHYGYGGILSRVWSHKAVLSAFRAYLCNAMLVNNCWFGVTNLGGWQFEVFATAGAAPSDQGVRGITFNETIFNSASGDDAGSNGLRISERIKQVRVNGYFEGHRAHPISGVGGIALQVGCNISNHEEGLIPTAVDIDGADAPTLDARFAAVEVDLTGMTGGYTGNNFGPGSTYQFNNVTGVEWGNAISDGRNIIYTEFTRDIRGAPQSVAPQASFSVNTSQATNLSANATGGDDQLAVTSTANFTTGDLVAVRLVGVANLGANHYSTIASIDDGTHLTLDDPIPTGRTAANGTWLTRNWSNVKWNNNIITDPYSRGGPEINLVPYGNFPGTVAHSTTGGHVHGVKNAIASFSDGLVTVQSDTTVRRNGRLTLKMTRLAGAAGNHAFEIIPFGQQPVNGPAVLAIAGWILVENKLPYSSTTYTNNTTYDLPRIGIRYMAGGSKHYDFQNLGSSGRVFDCGKWHPFYLSLRVGVPVITDIGLYLRPSMGGYVYIDSASVWFDSLGLFVNPKDERAIMNGDYEHNPAAGMFTAGGAFVIDEVPAASGQVYHQRGDRYYNPTPSSAGYIGKVCTTAGIAGTATLNDFGEIA